MSEKTSGGYFLTHAVYLGTVENHGKKWQKTRHTLVKIAKITAAYIADNLAKN